MISYRLGILFRDNSLAIHSAVLYFDVSHPLVISDEFEIIFIDDEVVINSLPFYLLAPIVY